MNENALPEEEREIILCGPLAQAESLLAIFLRSDHCTIAILADLAVGLFQKNRYSLATMIFAKWTESQPNNPEPWANLGLCLLRSNKLNDAQQVLDYALELDPGFLAARITLCDVYRELGLYERQLACAEECMRRQPASPVVQNNLGSALWHVGRTTEAKQAFNESLRLDSYYFEARFNLARLMSEEGDNAAATAFLEASLCLDGIKSRQRDVVEHHLSFEYLSTGRLAEGWPMYERGFSALVPASLARRPDRQFSVPRWTGQQLMDSQVLMVWREQGIGDELRFAALLPELKKIGGQIIVECDPRLVDIVQRSLPTFQVRVSPSETERSISSTKCDYDFQIPIGSLAGYYLRTPDIFGRLGGFLQPSPFQAAKFAQRLSQFDGMKKVGICWRSHQLSATRNKKYTSLEDWSEILSTPHAVFVNLQYGECEQELLDAERRHGIKILRWSDTDLKDDLEAVMGIMQNLDLVISPSTAVVPLAGAIGRKTIFIGHPSWVMLGEKSRYPWFSSVHPVLVDKKLPVASGLPEAKRLMDALLSESV
jgi:tetratricopeptide (TPR) repeat protein